jgi:ribosomal protein L29
MTNLKIKEIEKMNKEEKMKKIEELKFELVKARASAAKSGTSKARDIRRMIARILTLNNQENKKGVGKK